MSPPHPTLIFGTGNLGGPWPNPAKSEKGFAGTLEALDRLGIKRLDTAGNYPPGGTPGDSEKIIGASGVASQPAGFQVDTKIVWPSGTAEGSLTAANIDSSVVKSLENLGVDQINVLYPHWPDPATPLEEQVEGFEEQRRKGRCRQIGISNFTPQMVEDWVAICKRKGYALPVAHQGNYSLAFRHDEATLFPVLRRHGISIIAYSSLASGFLSGRLTEGTVEENPCAPAADPGCTRHQPRGRRVALDRVPLGPARRLGDAILLGASRTEQVEQSAAAIAEGPLPADVVEGIEAIWAKAAAAIPAPSLEAGSGALADAVSKGLDAGQE
ncbi:hypothetical protein MAPG_06320 [Magnaporthiopsis poae ATCC 64411]|uniref:NADP-dependent oxidoreductase domain-containing protein n=1 Tax=Magnaporthiopsis poae (strain ATCC 64411 / 73-15) TaxID=644358 RepID=A0A0C4E1Q3_MAGP6|nr:hypothetical protein MAPG_06320 [Magnaporthiopsis poae ATCC 64411]